MTLLKNLKVGQVSKLLICDTHAWYTESTWKHQEYMSNDTTRFSVQSKLTTLSSHAPLLRGWGEMTQAHFPEVGVCFRVFTEMYWQPQIHVCFNWQRHNSVRWTRRKNAKHLGVQQMFFFFILTYTLTCIRTGYTVNILIFSHFRGGASWQILWSNVSWQFQSQKSFFFSAVLN